ncbi:Ig-like domain-containing protein [Nannocystis punicea]|uniref:Ig-like domain-containing protein n=1 Tax=Nannocystis punicea TaxID=2995304 RepID=A0ABY7H920_9BACT|nr:Ig-like domain-containing protein [Nannocystis poenicansa]WAS95590.1 Ig-like domain-containing protein [Nannocystis poenicansa]
MRRMRVMTAAAAAVLGCGEPTPNASATDDSTTQATSSGTDVETTGAPATTTSSGDASTASGGEPPTSTSEAATSEAATTEAPEPNPYPEPGAFPPDEGPGGPQVGFTDAQLGVECATLDGGMDGDVGNGELHDTEEHHNLVQMFNGYLLMPWAPEYGVNAGVTFYDVSDPCAPKAIGSHQSPEMRESHSLGFANYGDRWYMAVDQMRLLLGGGIEIWDITDPTAMEVVSKVEVPNFFYPDAYQRVTLSVFWQVPYLYVAGADNGIFIIDASDPYSPELVAQHKFDPILRAGQVQVVGNLLMTSAAEGVRTALLDVSKPDFPQPIAGGEFAIPREAYFSNLAGGHAYYAPKEGGGGLIVYDISNPGAPALVGDFASGGNGGYVFVKDEFAFVGESEFANIYDLTDPSDPTPVRTMTLTGDLDTITPIGNVAVLSVDDKADADRGSTIVPWAKEVDTTPPRVTWAWPADGATDLPLTSRFGLTFNEFVATKSAWAGSVRLYETGTDPALTRVDGHVSAQEVIVNFSPGAPLKPGTQYTLEVPAGGIHDYNGNAIAEPFTITFTTAGG